MCVASTLRESADTRVSSRPNRRLGTEEQDESRHFRGSLEDAAACDTLVRRAGHTSPPPWGGAGSLVLLVVGGATCRARAPGSGRPCRTSAPGRCAVGSVCVMACVRPRGRAVRLRWPYYIHDQPSKLKSPTTPEAYREQFSRVGQLPCTNSSTYQLAEPCAERPEGDRSCLRCGRDRPTGKFAPGGHRTPRA